MKVFILECPNPIDLLYGRAESKSIENICKLIGHQAVSFSIKSESEFMETIRYISTIDKAHDRADKRNEPLCIHLSAHGNEEGLDFGDGLKNWSKIHIWLKPLMKNIEYDGKVILVISACGANKQYLTKLIRKDVKRDVKDSVVPLKYIFVFAAENVRWSDAAIAWAILYHGLAKYDLEKKQNVINLIKRMKKSDFGDLLYFRWDEKKQRYKKPRL